MNLKYYNQFIGGIIMKQKILAIFLFTLCMTVYFNIKPQKDANAAGLEKDISSETKNSLDSDLAELYTKYSADQEEIEKKVTLDINKLFATFVKESSYILKCNEISKEGYKRLQKLKIQTFKELNNIYAEGTEEADKELYQYKDCLYKIAKNYNDYNITSPEALNKVNVYLILAEDNSIHSKLDSRIKFIKENIKTLISEYGD